jgi:hypothetical protein
MRCLLANIMDKPTSFIRILILLEEAFQYGDGANLSGYAGTSAEPLCAEFCYLVQYHTLVNYLTFAINERK